MGNPSTKLIGFQAPPNYVHAVERMRQVLTARHGKEATQADVLRYALECAVTLQTGGIQLNSDTGVVRDTFKKFKAYTKALKHGQVEKCPPISKLELLVGITNCLNSYFGDDQVQQLGIFFISLAMSGKAKELARHFDYLTFLDKDGQMVGGRTMRAVDNKKIQEAAEILQLAAVQRKQLLDRAKEQSLMPNVLNVDDEPPALYKAVKPAVH